MYETMRGRPVAMGTSLARASQASEPCRPNQAFLSKSPGIKPIRRSASAMACPPRRPMGKGAANGDVVQRPDDCPDDAHHHGEAAARDGDGTDGRARAEEELACESDQHRADGH